MKERTVSPSPGNFNPIHPLKRPGSRILAGMTAFERLRYISSDESGRPNRDATSRSRSDGDREVAAPVRISSSKFNSIPDLHRNFTTETQRHGDRIDPNFSRCLRASVVKIPTVRRFSAAFAC